MSADDKTRLESLTANVPPALESFVNTVRARVFTLAAAQGYAPEEAVWIEARMRLPLLQRIADGVAAEEAFDASYRAARRALLADIFETALADGGGRAGAFRRLVDLEYAMAERLGEPEPAYSNALVEAGCEAAAAAASEGATVDEQIDTGFAIMRELAPVDPVASRASAERPSNGSQPKMALTRSVAQRRP